MSDYKSSRLVGFDHRDKNEQLLFDMLARSLPDQRVADSIGVSNSTIKAIRTIARLALEADADGGADDLVAMIEERQEPPTSNPFGAEESLSKRNKLREVAPVARAAWGTDDFSLPTKRYDRANLLEALAQNLLPGDIRGVGQSLLKLADAIDQDWYPESARLKYSWLSQAGRIERNSIGLAKVAAQIREVGKRRQRYISADFLGEPAWEMLLELFIQFSGGAKVSTKSLCIVSGVPSTTALRWIVRLEKAGLVERSKCPYDKRVTYISLTKHGVISVGSILRELSS